MLSLNAGFLRQKGFDVTEASDGERAWSLAEDGAFDLVLLDVMMPGMSGWEVCKRVKNNPSSAQTAVVMLTGIGETLNDMTSSLFAADAWLNKPYDFGELERKLREALARYGKDMPDGGSALYAKNDEPPPSLPTEALGPAVRKASPKPAAKPKAAPKKAAPKKAAPKKAAPKKAAPKKAAPKKAASKKAAPKKAAPKKAAKKAAPKKAAPKKAAPKKAGPKKAAKKPAKKR
ncbi:MAG: response regulator [Myxococcales bacterium]|nr:response regulator [Myxococcales bacterium]